MTTIEKALSKHKGQGERPAIEQGASTPQAQSIDQLPEGAPSDKSPDLDDRQFTIDTELLSKRGFLSSAPDSGGASRMNEEYRFIKRKILHNAFAAKGNLTENGNLVMITSTKPREGKTFNAINLALSIALEKDKTVLLIDGDVLKPSICNDLGIENDRPGLLDYLSGSENDAGNIIYPTNVEQIRIMPAGSQHVLSTELLASARMESLIKELTERYPDRVIIIDAPPVLGISDTHVLSHYAGQIVFVVEQNSTSMKDVQSALTCLPEDTVIGFVMNKATEKSNAGYGYYGYGYGYGYRYGYGAKKS